MTDVDVYFQVAYHGIPDKAYEVFLDAHKHNSLTRRSNALDSKNPAGNTYNIHNQHVVQSKKRVLTS